MHSNSPNPAARWPGSQAKDNAIPGKYIEIMAGHIADQTAHRESADESGDEAYAYHRYIGGGELVPVLVHVVESRREHGRHSQEKGKLGGHLAIQAEQHAADNGGARARSTRHHGKHLGDADLQRVLPAHIVNADHPRHLLPTLNQQDDHAANHQGQRHRHRVEQVMLDRLDREEANDRRRQKPPADC